MEWLGELKDVFGYRQTEMDLSSGEVALRALLVYVVVLAVIRAGEKRFLGRNTAFDMVVAIMVGSLAARAITGNSPLIPALVAAAALVGIHWVAAALAFRSRRFGRLIKGRSREIVRDGALQEGAMKESDVTRHDLQEAMRRQGMTELGEVREAHLERDGSISVVPRDRREPRVVEIQVEEGVQTVRLEVA